MILHHAGNIGGGGLSLYSISKMLSNHYEVKIYCPKEPSDILDFLNQKGLKAESVQGFGTINSYNGGPRPIQRSFWNGLLKIPKSIISISKLVDRENPDVVIVNSIVLSWVGLLIKKKKVKSVCFVRETAKKSLWTKLQQYFLNNWFDGVIFISEYDKRLINSKAPITGVVRDCIELNDYKEGLDLSREKANKLLNLDSSKFHVLFVGGTSFLKGWPVILQAMESLKDKNIDLVVAGKNNLGEAFSRENIHFLGVRTDMSVVYRACDVLVFPSTAAHQARPVFEAGFMKLPVIISDFEQTREHIEHMKNGLTFNPGSDIELSRSIKRLYDDPELFKTLGKNNYKNAIKNHEFTVVKRELISLLKRILAYTK